MTAKLQHTIWRMQQSNAKAFSLAFIRVALSVWYIKEMLFRWSSYEVLYSNGSFLDMPPTKYFHNFHLNLFWLKEHYQFLIWGSMLLLVLNLFGIGRNLVSLLLWFVFSLLYHMNNAFFNSGDEMSLILLFFLSFSNSYDYLTLFKRKQLSAEKEKLYNFISNLAALCIMINLCLAYFSAGFFKLMDPWWQKGTGIYYFLNDDRYSILAAGGKNVQFPLWFIYLVNWGTIILELLFPVLVWFKKYRTVVFGLCLLMHAGIYSFLMIYAMTFTFLIQYCIFYPDNKVKALFEKIRGFVSRLFSFAGK